VVFVLVARRFPVAVVVADVVAVPVATMPRS
jgi:hypothetical protein